MALPGRRSSCGVSGYTANLICVGEQDALFGQVLIYGFYENLLDFLLGQVRCLANLIVLVFMVAEENPAFVLVVGMPDFGTVPVSALSALDLGSESADPAVPAVIVFPADTPVVYSLRFAP